MVESLSSLGTELQFFGPCVTRLTWDYTLYLQVMSGTDQRCKRHFQLGQVINVAVTLQTPYPHDLPNLSIFSPSKSGVSGGSHPLMSPKGLTQPAQDLQLAAPGSRLQHGQQTETGSCCRQRLEPGPRHGKNCQDVEGSNESIYIYII